MRELLLSPIPSRIYNGWSSTQRMPYRYLRPLTLQYLYIPPLRTAAQYERRLLPVNEDGPDASTAHLSKEVTLVITISEL